MNWKKWLGAVLLAGWLAPSQGAAQYLPSAVGAARMPEPLPVGACPSPTPNLVPGPISPLAAPPGPKEDLSLPANHSSAFQCEEFAVHPNLYFHAGTQFLQRQRLGHQVAIYTDGLGAAQLDNGVNINPNAFQPVLDSNGLVSQMVGGVKAAMGYLWDNYGVELSGYYIPLRSTDSFVVGDPFQLNSFFINPPPGFQGNNGLWLQGDRAGYTLENTIWNAELNVRYYSKAVTGLEPILGIRYLDQRERYGITFDDDGLAFPNVLGQPNQTRIATYAVRSINRIVAPQAGIEYQFNIVKGLVVGLNTKVSLGVNLAETLVTLDRGDGVRGLTGTRSRTNFAQVYEFGATVDLYLLERMRVRAGYMAMFLGGVLDASDQVNFDLSQPRGRQDNFSYIFYHGPSIELQFLF